MTARQRQRILWEPFALAAIALLAGFGSFSAHAVEIVKDPNLANMRDREMVALKVDTVAAMSALTEPLLKDGQLVETAGYVSALDGGGNVYRWNASSSATVNGGFVIDGPGADGRFLAINQTVANVLQFGATANNSADDDADNIQAAITACNVIEIPPGTFHVVDDSTITSGKTIRGFNNGSSIVKAKTGSAANGPVFTLTDPGASNGYCEHSHIADIEVEGVDGEGGIGILLSGAQYCTLTRVHLDFFRDSNDAGIGLDVQARTDHLCTRCSFYSLEVDNSDTAIRIDSQVTGQACGYHDFFSTKIGAEVHGIKLLNSNGDGSIYCKFYGTFFQGTGSAYHSGTSTAGSSTTITLAGGASAVDDFYNGDRVILASMNQDAIITDYNGTTKVATVVDWPGSDPGSGVSYVVSGADGLVCEGSSNIFDVSFDAWGGQEVVMRRSAQSNRVINYKGLGRIASLYSTGGYNTLYDENRWGGGWGANSPFVFKNDDAGAATQIRIDSSAITGSTASSELIWRTGEGEEDYYAKVSRSDTQAKLNFGGGDSGDIFALRDDARYAQFLQAINMQEKAFTEADEASNAINVSQTTNAVINAGSAITLTNFVGGNVGQVLFVEVVDANTTINDSASIDLGPQGNYAAQAGGATFWFKCCAGGVWKLMAPYVVY